MIASLVVAIIALQQDSGPLTLADAVRRALKTEPTVAAARDSRDAAGAAVGEARAPLFPRLQASFGTTRYKIGSLVYPLSGIDPRNPPLFNTTVSQGVLSLGYTIFDFGARRSQLRLAHAQERKADAARDAASAALVSNVATAYLRVLTTRGVLDAQQHQVAALQAEAKRIALLESQGKAAHVEVLRLAAEASRARADEIGTRAQLDVAERTLAQLVDLPVDSLRARLAAVWLADTTVADRATLVATAQNNSPDVIQARRAADAARAGVGLARAALLPQLQLSAAYMEDGYDLKGFRPFWSAGLALSYPIFTGGSRISAIHRNEATARAAADQLRAAEQASERSVDAALATVTAARATVQALETAVEQSQEVERIRLLSLQVGSGTETDYLDAEATLLAQRASLVQARHAEIAARIELARLAGELTPDWLAQVVQQP
jgi:outer membrane protein TolC